MADIVPNVVVSMPSQQFTLARSFKAAANGKIYIGKIDTDPVNPENQIQVYIEGEDGSYVPVSQPIIINAGGYPVYNGQIAKFVTVEGHSMAIYDAYGAQQFYFPNVLKYDPDQLKYNLSQGDGFGLIGRAGSISELRNIKPKFSGQRILIDSYYSGWAATAYGKPTGVTDFVAVFGSFIDDGGMTITSWADCAWKRDIDPEDALITHFGAIPDGVTVCDDAFINMYRWAYGDAAQSNTDPAINVINNHNGSVRFGEGVFAMNNANLTSYGRKRNVKIIGDSLSDYRSLNTTIICTNIALPAIVAPALEVEISGFNVIGGLDNNVTFAGGFYQNPYASAPQRIRARAINIEQMGGRIFDVTDTMDSEFTQMYMDKSNSTLIYAKWSGSRPGWWDHTTAINIRDVSVWNNGANPVFFIPRCHQAMMNNVWVSQCQYVGNLSQGWWGFDMLILEGNTVGIRASNLRHYGHYEVTSGAGFDYSSGADEIPASWDASLGVPDYVTNPQWEMGVSSVDEKGFYSRDGHVISAFSASRRFIANAGSTTQWVNVGSVYLPATGHSCRVRIVACGGYNAVIEGSNANDTRFGNGVANIDIQNKGDNEKDRVTWYCEGGSPVLDVKYVKVSASTTQIYALVNSFTPRAAVFCETNSSSRMDAGIHFFFTFSGASVSDINSITTTQSRSKWLVGRGDTTGGVGMDFTAGRLILGGAISTIQVGGKATLAFPVYVNGTLRYIPLVSPDS